MPSRFMELPSEKVPVLAEVDVAVAGGGPAGFAAAVAAAREGARTLLVEATGCLGGQGTNGLVGPFMATAGTEGVFDELRHRLAELGGLGWGSYKGFAGRLAFDAEVLKYAMQLMCEESGAAQLLFATVEKPLTMAGRVSGLVTVTKGGRGVVRAGIVVDATGDGDVAAAAGAAFDKGREDGHIQASSLFMQIGGVDDAAMTAGKKEYGANCLKYARIEREAGRLNLAPYVNMGLVWKGSTLGPGQYSVNVDTSVGRDCTDPTELTTANNESRHRAFEVLAFFRKYLPGAANCYIEKTGSIFGVRETRRLRGLATVSGHDVVNGTKREDGICRASFFLDLHDGDADARGRLHENMRQKYGPRITPPEGDWYEIPYGSLVPESVNGLLVAGRCISSDRDANGSLRIMPTCMATGQAAGIAAAISAREGVEPRSLPTGKVQAVLRGKYGVMLARDLVST